MKMKCQLLLLLILASDVGTDQDICSDQRSTDSNECQSDLSDEDTFEDHASIYLSKSLTTDAKEEAKSEDDSLSFIYPPLTRRTPKQPGDIQEVEISGGRKVKLITRSVNPPLFEIPNFLTEEECDDIVMASKQKGTARSTVFATKAEREKGTDKHSGRTSENVQLDEDELVYGLMDRLNTKVAKLIDMPIDVVRDVGPLMIGKYNEGGHYHVHLDSNPVSLKKPCCFQTICNSGSVLEDTKECCVFCRYATVLHYLNDVEKGGETAFPLADLTSAQIEKLDKEWVNLTANCHKAKLRIKPEKGKSILWYNHFVDKQGYLGSLDKRSYHGGCDVLKGTKWIATNWISTPQFSQRRVPSKFKKYAHGI